MFNFPTSADVPLQIRALPIFGIGAGPKMKILRKERSEKGKANVERRIWRVRTSNNSSTRTTPGRPCRQSPENTPVRCVHSPHEPVSRPALYGLLPTASHGRHRRQEVIESRPPRYVDCTRHLVEDGHCCLVACALRQADASES